MGKKSGEILGGGLFYLPGKHGIFRREFRGKFRSKFHPYFSVFGALRKGPPFHGSRSSREMKIQKASCQMGGREVTR